jgi:aldose 1-epimerase
MKDDFSDIRLFELTNANGMQVAVTNYGATLQAIKVADRRGVFADVVLGHNRVKDYINAIDRPYLGAIVGRFGNRIAGGRFTLDGQEFQLPLNNGPNCLHGGFMGFDKVVWDARAISGQDWTGIELSYLAKDGEEGFPGNLQVTVTYRLNNENEISIDYLAVTDKATHVNLTQHSYFNLKGEGEDDILGHQLMIHADFFTPINQDLIPTGALQSVADTPFDFRTPKVIGRDINADDQQLRFGLGYDHNWVLNQAKEGKEMRLAAELFEPGSGRVLTVLTQEPGIQFYSGNFLDGRLTGKTGKSYAWRGGLCLETQHFPDSPNQPGFPTTILRPGEKYQTKTIFRFSTR